MFKSIQTLFILFFTANLFAAGPGFFKSGGWEFSGQNKIKVDLYDVSGNKSNGPYPFEGTFYSNNLETLFERVEENGRFTQIQLEGQTADNPYLSDDGIFDLQYASLLVEHGEVGLPYKLTLGDSYVKFTNRTLQKSIKGVTAELQPKNLKSGNHSILITSGSGEVRWDQIGNNDIWFHGLSYLIENKINKMEASIEANAVLTKNSNNSALSASSPNNNQDQLILGVNGELKVSKALRIEAEIAKLKNIEESAENTDAASYFLKGSGYKNRISWHSKLEQNDRLYSPAGGAGIIANRRVFENFASYSLPAKYRSKISGKAAFVTTGIQAAEEVDGTILGLGYTFFPLLLRKKLRTHFALDYNKFTADNLLNTNRSFKSFTFIVNDQFSHGYFGSYRGNIRENDDENTGTNNIKATTHALNFGRKFKVKKFDFIFQGGLIYTNQWENNRYSLLSPHTKGTIGYGKHELSYNIKFANQDFGDSTVSDLWNDSTGFSYNYRNNQHEIELEYDRHKKKPENQTHTEDHRVSLSYIYYFGSAARL